MNQALTNKFHAYMDAELLYEAYPRHVAKADAIRAIKKALKLVTERNGVANPKLWLLGRVQEFSASAAGQAGAFVPHPATWMNQGRYDDNPDEWNRQQASENRSPARVCTPKDKYARVGRKVAVQARDGSGENLFAEPGRETRHDS